MGLGFGLGFGFGFGLGLGFGFGFGFVLRFNQPDPHHGRRYSAAPSAVPMAVTLRPATA